MSFTPEERDAEIRANIQKMLRRFDDATLFSGLHARNGLPRLILFLRLRYWSLPLSVSIGGHMLSRPGCVVGVGPFYFSWSWL